MPNPVETYFDTWNVPDDLRKLASRDIPHWINGKAVVSGETIDVVEPSTSTVISRTFEAGKEHVNAAIKAARQAFEGDWSNLRPLDRQALMLRLADLIEANADELAFLESVDVGKSVVQAKEIDIGGSVDVLRHFAGYCTRIEGRTAPLAAYEKGSVGMTIKRPVGVVAAIAPWNFPLQTLIWKCAAAFATGCVVVAKPSEVTPMTALRLGELTAEARFPPGVFNVVNGTGAITGAALTSHPDVDKISFTGSTGTGIAVGQVGLASMTRLTLELGGKSAAIVTADADLDVAVEGVVNGIFFNSGQVCDGTSRVVVDGAVYEDFMMRLVKATQGLKMGAGLDPDTFMGPMVSIDHKAKVAGFIAAAQEAGLALPVQHTSRRTHGGLGAFQ
ncbi:aldehyde dehydrogenase [Pseudohalocynthiibacter aestuariivivens]|nr:aldehyde dehydrogenase family protein [Pseudohalocynthiibacter aestuariivivens]QIE45201.1 aldehyde dehydrogenase [Pseudohalocynthiibacter aestuariivivens]